MKAQHQNVRRATAMLSAALTVVALSACANPVEHLVERGTEKAVEKLIEQGTGSEIEVDTDGGSITFGDGETTIDMGANATLPSNWPDIPTPTGQVVMSTQTDTGQMVVFQSSDAEMEALLASFASAGFQTENSVDMAPIRSEQLRRDSLRVMLQWYTDDEDFTVQYMVFTDAD